MTINRRELLERIAVLLGGAISAPAALAVLQGCTPKTTSASKPVFLTELQVETVAEIAEIMIPRTDTPGAKDVGVPAFIDSMLKQTYEQADRERFVSGLGEFEARAEQEHGRRFMLLARDQRVALVQRDHDQAVMEERNRPASGMAVRRPFILMTKELTLLGYFSSEVGATQVLQYDPVPGAYRGCMPLSEAGNGRTWAGESTLRF